MDGGRFPISADALYPVSGLLRRADRDRCAARTGLRRRRSGDLMIFGAIRCPASVDGWALALSITAMLAIFHLKTRTLRTLLACSAARLFLRFVGAVG